MTHVSHRTIPQLLGFADTSLTDTRIIPIGFYAGFEGFTCNKFLEVDVCCITGSNGSFKRVLLALGTSLRRRLGSVIILRRE